MNPTKKANALIEQFAPMMPNEHWQDKAIECAIICCNECIRASQYIAHLNHSYHEFETTEFWMQVRTSLQNR